MLPILQTLTRSATNAVASCSNFGTARYLYSKSGHNAFRSRNWQIAEAYPAPTPLMPKEVSDGGESIDLSEEEEPIIPRKPQTSLKYAKGKLPEEWKQHRAVLKESFPAGWSPPKKLSREAMDGLRMLHSQNPEVFSTPVLASKFRISPEAVRRILKSKWEPTREQRQKLAERGKKEAMERSRKRYLEEIQSRVQTIVEKKNADREENELYWSKQTPEARIEAEKQNRRGHRARLGRQSQRFGREMPQSEQGRSRKDLFFS